VEIGNLTMQYADPWQPIESAPKDGSWVFAYGRAYKELAENGWNWITHEMGDPLVPFMSPVRWVEGWYDKEIDHGDGSYHKERTLSYSYWGPHAHAFQPTHWMPMPAPPKKKR